MVYYVDADRQKVMIDWCADLLGRDDWVVLDTETTGVKSRDEVVSIGIVNHQGEQVFSSLIKPTIPIPEEATAVHGITDEDASYAPSLSTVIYELRDVVRGKVIIAYNADFDSRLLAQSFKKRNLKPLRNKWECAMKQFARYYGEYNHRFGNYRWQSLETAVKSVGVEQVFQFHGAMQDAIATYELIKAIGTEHDT